MNQRPDFRPLRPLRPLALAAVLLGGLAAASAAHAQVRAADLRSDAPAVYTVKKGDDIRKLSRLYLREPKAWAKLADGVGPVGPGAVLELVQGSEGARLVRSSTGQIEQRLSPAVRIEPLDGDAGVAIPIGPLLPFMNRSLILDRLALEQYPVVKRTDRGRLPAGAGGRIITGEQSLVAGTHYDIYRPGRVLRDHASGSEVGQEAVYVGRASVLPGNQPAMLQVISAVQEIGPGDRLLPQGAAAEPPSQALRGAPDSGAAVIHIEDGRAAPVRVYKSGPPVSAGAGRLGVVALDRGLAAGLRAGHLVRLANPAATEGADGHAQALVFRVFEQSAYALVVNAAAPVQIGDRALSALPEKKGDQ